MASTCLTCSTRPLKNGVYLAVMQDFVRKRLPTQVHPKVKYNKNAPPIHVSNLRPNTYVFYFATQKRNFQLAPLPQKKAYAKLQNSGIAKTDENGKTTFYLDCPQIYINDNGKIYSRHFHYVFYDDILKEWTDTLYTQRILCTISKTEALTYKKAIIIDVSKLNKNKDKNMDDFKSLIGKPILLKGKKAEVESFHKKLNNLGIYNTMFWGRDGKE